MSDIAKISSEIEEFTVSLKMNYPELYKVLDETPYTETGDNVSALDLEDYLNTLKEQVKHFIKRKK